MTTSSEVYEKLRNLAPESSDTSNAHILGGGLIADIGLESAGENISLTLIDEKAARGSGDMIIARIGREVTRFALSTLIIEEVERPTETLDGVAKAIELTPQTPQNEAMGWMAAILKAWSAEPNPEIKVDEIRGLISDINVEIRKDLSTA